MSAELAIVIPAYKAQHLQQALASIAAQTDQRFRVYVGDDASPQRLEPLVRASRIDPKRIEYRRFSENLGRTSLVGHWNRCIQMTDEPWLWLFSDDDEMEPDCVAAFYRHREATGSAFDLYRFNTAVIDAAGDCVSLNPSHPAWESAREHAYFLLRGFRRPTQQELIFRRDTYDQTGGFVDLPLAWYADTVFALSIGRRQGVYTIDQPRVRFRLSGENISSKNNPARVLHKWEALRQFADWMEEFIRDTSDQALPNDDMLLEALHERFMLGLSTPKAWINGHQRRLFGAFLQKHFPEHYAADKLRIIKYNLSVGTKLLMASLPRRRRKPKAPK